VTVGAQIDMSALIAMRNEYKDAFEKKHGVKLGFMSPFVKVCLSCEARV
jgi:2-oxoglutarate dehydrogenase E2 component (dihydrolipoamide succinyltransferase)